MDFAAEFKRLEEHFNSSIHRFNTKLQHAVGTVDDVTSLNDIQKDFTAFKDGIMVALADINNIFTNLDNRMDELENESRKNCLLVHGITEKEKENPVSVIEDLITMVKLDPGLLTNGCIGDVRRFGKSTDKSRKKPRPLLVAFTNNRHKNLVWDAKKELKGTKILITEFLTRRRMILFNEARAAFGPRNAWTYNGSIHAAVGKEKMRITSLSQIEGLKGSAVIDIDPASTQRPLPGPITRSKNVSR